MQSNRSNLLADLFRNERILALLLVMAAVALYAPALNGAFIWDDPAMLWTNPAVTAHAGGLWEIWTGRGTPDYFPLTSTVFWTEWRLWGMSPLGYRLLNVLLHAGSALLLWRVLLRLRVHWAWGGALLFALHPLAVGSVAWIAELKNTLSLPLALLALLCYLRFVEEGGRWWYGAALAAFLLALLAKTSVVMLPLLLLLLAFQRGDDWRRTLARTAPFFALALVLGLVTVHFQATQAGAAVEPETRLAFLTRIEFAGRALWFYLGKLLVPSGLCAVYPAWRPAPQAWLALLPAAAWTAFVAAAWRLQRRTSGGGMDAWMLPATLTILLLPVLGLVSMSFHQYAWVSDHLAYVAVPVAAAFAAACCGMLWNRGGGFRSAGALLFLAVAGWWGALAAEQVALHRDPAALWNNVIRANPGCWVGYHNAGEALIRESVDRGAPVAPEKLGAAQLLFQEAHRRKPQNITRFFLGYVSEKLGRPAEAEAWFRRALELNPADVWSEKKLGLLLQQRGCHAEAEDCYRDIVRLWPGDEEARYNLGNALAAQDRPAEALAAYREALRLRPDYPEASTNAADALARLGRHKEALDLYLSVAQEQPQDASAAMNAGCASLRAGRVKDAMAWLLKARALDPQSAAILLNLGIAHASCGGTEAALACWRDVAKLEPASPEPHRLAAKALAAAGRAAEAESESLRAAQLERRQSITTQSKK